MDDLLPVQSELSDASPDKPSCDELTGGDQELGTANPDDRASQLSATPVVVTPSPTPPRIRTPVVGSTPRGSLEPMEEPRHRNPLVTTSSEGDVSDYLPRPSEMVLDATHLTHQTGEPTAPYLHSSPQPTPHAVKQPIPLIVEETTLSTTEEATVPSVGNPAILPVKELIPPVAGDTTPPDGERLNPIPTEGPVPSGASITPVVGESNSPVTMDLAVAPTIPQPIQQTRAPRFSLSSFQSASIWTTIIRGLQITVPRSTPQNGEQPIPSTIEESATPRIEESIPPVNVDTITPTDEVLIHAPAEEPVALIEQGPAVEELIHPAIEGTVTPADEPTHLPATGGSNSRVIEEPIASQSNLTPTTGAQSPSHPRAADPATNTPSAADTSETSGVVKESTSLAHEEQDEEDALVVDAFLTSSPDLDTASQLPRGNTQPSTQEDAEGAVPTSVEPNSTPDSSGSATDTPMSMARRPEPHPFHSQETLAPALPRHHRDTGGLATSVPPSVQPMLQESTIQPPDSHSVLNTHPPHEDTDHTGSDAIPSSPIVEGDSFWHPGAEATQDESQTSFARACVTAISSPADSRGSGNSLQSADLHRRISFQQGTDTYPIL